PARIPSGPQFTSVPERQLLPASLPFRSPRHIHLHELRSQTPRNEREVLIRQVKFPCFPYENTYKTMPFPLRSITLDTWNKKQIALMEHGGNGKATEFFRKYNLRVNDTTPVDYKTPNVQRYKEDLVRHVEALFKPAPAAPGPKA